MKVDKTKWEKKTLGEIGQIITGSTPSTKDSRNYDSDDIPFFKPGDLNDYSVNELSQSIDSISYYGFENSRKLPAGTILVTCIGIIGKIGILSKPATCNQQINAIICNDSFSNRFIAYNILFHKDTLSQKANGPVVPIINKSSFSKYIIKVPQSITEQRAIAAELDAVQKIIEGYKAQLADLDTLAQSIFLDMFGDPITNPKGWETKKLVEICNIFAGGDKPSDISEIRTDEYKYPVIANGDGNRGILGYSKDCRVKDSSVTIGARGASVGNCRIVKGGFTPAIRLITLIPKCFLDCHYLYYFAKEIDYKTTGTGQAQLTVPNIKNELCPLPPLPLQQQFAERVEAIERQKELLQAQLAEAQTLMAERMQYYFD